MGFFSKLFTTDKKVKIDALKRQIENHKRIIDTVKHNMELSKRSNGPKHYQESGKKNIETQNYLIRKAKEEISSLKK